MSSLKSWFLGRSLFSPLLSLRVLANGQSSQKEQLQEKILDLERLELQKIEVVNHYEHWHEQFNDGLPTKGLKKEMLVIRYTRKEKNFLSKWEGWFQVMKQYDNGSYKL